MGREEFRDIMMQAYPQMRAMAMRLLSGNPDNVADALQDTALSLWKNLSTFEKAANRTAYVVGAVRKTCLTRISAARESFSENHIPEIADDTTADDKDTEEYLQTLISSLPPVQAEIVRLNVVQGYSGPEIAEKTGLSPENVRQMLSRARRTLRTLYTKKNI